MIYIYGNHQEFIVEQLSKTTFPFIVLPSLKDVWNLAVGGSENFWIISSSLVVYDLGKIMENGEEVLRENCLYSPDLQPTHNDFQAIIPMTSLPQYSENQHYRFYPVPNSLCLGVRVDFGREVGGINEDISGLALEFYLAHKACKMGKKSVRDYSVSCVLKNTKTSSVGKYGGNLLNEVEVAEGTISAGIELLEKMKTKKYHYTSDLNAPVLPRSGCGCGH